MKAKTRCAVILSGPKSTDAPFSRFLMAVWEIPQIWWAVRLASPKFQPLGPDRQCPACSGPIFRELVAGTRRPHAGGAVAALASVEELLSYQIRSLFDLHPACLAIRYLLSVTGSVAGPALFQAPCVALSPCLHTFSMLCVWMLEPSATTLGRAFKATSPPHSNSLGRWREGSSKRSKTVKLNRLPATGSPTERKG